MRAGPVIVAEGTGPERMSGLRSVFVASAQEFNEWSEANPDAVVEDFVSPGVGSGFYVVYRGPQGRA